MRLNAKKRPLKLVDLMRALNARLPQDNPRASASWAMAPSAHALERAIVTPRSERPDRRRRPTLARGDSRRCWRRATCLCFRRFVSRLASPRSRRGARDFPSSRCARRASPSVIEHGREGLLAESDVELASSCRDDSCADLELRAAIADHNRRTSPPFDWPRTLDAHLAIYREAIALRDSA